MGYSSFYPLVHDVVLARNEHGVMPSILRDAKFPTCERDLLHNIEINS